MDTNTVLAVYVVGERVWSIKLSKVHVHVQQLSGTCFRSANTMNDMWFCGQTLDWQLCEFVREHVHKRLWLEWELASQ